MTLNRPYNHYFIFALILITGFGLAAQSEIGAQSRFMNLHLQRKGYNASPAEDAKHDPDSEHAREAIPRYYVAKTGDGTNPTLGWTTAFTNVQDALAVADVTDGEIWVVAGVYYPDQGFGQYNDARDSTFVLRDNVALYGGFDTGDTQLSDRDWETNVTVLSGDIDGNDDTDANSVVTHTENIKGYNAYHVVTASGVTGSAVLDGFTITAGQANYENPNLWSDNWGGGFYGSGIDTNNSPSLSNITFSGNLAGFGGAMYNYSYRDDGDSSPSLSNVTFSGNSADQGGAIFNYGQESGSSSPSLSNVTFSGNSADIGGAMFNDGSTYGTSSPSLTNVVFSGNSADRLGGAMYNDGMDGTSSPSLVNVTFSGNSAGWYGGAMFNNGVLGTSSPKVRNSILWNNQDASGIGTISATIYNNDATTTLTHSLAQGTGDSSNWTPDPSYVDGGGNIGADPMFVTPIDPSTAPTTTGNLRLQSGSPAIDVGDNTFVTEVHSDLDGGPRIIDGNLDGTPTVDIGAYETPIDYPYDSYLPLINR